MCLLPGSGDQFGRTLGQQVLGNQFSQSDGVFRSGGFGRNYSLRAVRAEHHGGDLQSAITMLTQCADWSQASAPQTCEQCSFSEDRSVRVNVVD